MTAPLPSPPSLPGSDPTAIGLSVPATDSGSMPPANDAMGPAGAVSAVAGGALGGISGGLLGGVGVGGLLGLLGNVAGGLISEHSAESAANKQRQWEEYMSNTAYQRAVQDMQKAGLNPMMMLAKGGGPESTPSGATASVGQLGAGVQSAATMAAMQLPQMMASIAKQQADTRNTDAQTAAIGFSNANTIADTFLKQGLLDKYRSDLGVNAAQIGQLNAVANKAVQDSRLTGAEADVLTPIAKMISPFVSNAAPGISELSKYLTPGGVSTLWNLGKGAVGGAASDMSSAVQKALSDWWSQAWTPK